MQALVISRYGGPEVLKIEDRSASASVTPGHLRIAVSAAGINFADIMMRMGLYGEAPKPPFVPGYEFAGRVLEIGSGVQGFNVGDRVLGGTKFGGYVSEITLPAAQVRKTPEKLSDAEAAAIPVNFMTASVALDAMARVRKGDRVAILSAAGGVGTAAVQIAARAGARVTGVVGSSAKTALVKELGAAEAVLQSDWDAESGAYQGFDLVLDPIGGKSLKRNMKRLVQSGRIVNYGVSSMVGEKRSLTKILSMLVNTPILTPIGLMMRNQGLFGLNMLQFFDLPATPENPMYRAMDQVLASFARGELKAVVGKTFPLSQGGDAHAYVQSRASVGKVVLTMPESGRI